MTVRLSGSQQRCFNYNGLGYIGRNCPRKDLEGKLCYSCKVYTTDHIAANCTLSRGSNRRDRKYDNNHRRDYVNNGSGRGLKRKIESNNDESNSKRSKFNNDVEEIRKTGVEAENSKIMGSKKRRTLKVKVTFIV